MQALAERIECLPEACPRGGLDLSVMFWPAIRATVVAWLSRRCGERAPVTNPRPVEAVVAAGSRQGPPTAEGEAQPWT